MNLTPKIKYSFGGSLYRSSQQGGWYFVAMPQVLSKEIRKNLHWQEEGWGRMKAKAKILDLEWETAIWYDSKIKTYVLPLKAEIRKKANLEIGQKLDVVVCL